MVADVIPTDVSGTDITGVSISISGADVNAPIAGVTERAIEAKA